MNDRHIIWREVDHLKPFQGHGFELWYEFDKVPKEDFQSGKIIVAFVHEYGWFHGSKKPILIETLRPVSLDFTRRQLDGERIVAKAWGLIFKYFRENKLPRHESRLGGHLQVRLNA